MCSRQLIQLFPTILCFVLSSHSLLSNLHSNTQCIHLNSIYATYFLFIRRDLTVTETICVQSEEVQEAGDLGSTALETWTVPRRESESLRQLTAAGCRRDPGTSCTLHSRTERLKYTDSTVIIVTIINNKHNTSLSSSSSSSRTMTAVENAGQNSVRNISNNSTEHIFNSRTSHHTYNHGFL